MTKTASEYLVETLEKVGIRRVYGVFGDCLVRVEEAQELRRAITAALASRVMKGTMT